MSFVTKAEGTDRTSDRTVHQQRCDVQTKVDLGTVVGDEGQGVVVLGGAVLKHACHGMRAAGPHGRQEINY
jgi:hypothetical protein